MPRVGTGSVVPKTLTDGTCAYELRFHARGRRESVTLHERARCDADAAVAGTSARRVESSATSSRASALGSGPARRRIRGWRRTPRRRREPVPTFHEYASWWLTGEDRGRDRRQADRREHAGRLPLAPARASAAVLRRPAGSTRSTAESACASRRHKLRESAGAADRDRRRRRRSATGAGGESSRSGWHRSRSSSRRLAAILDEAIEDESHRPQPCARQSHARASVPKPTADVPRDGRAAGAHRRRGGAGRAPRCQPRCAPAGLDGRRRRSPSRSPRACAQGASPPSSGLQGHRQLPRRRARASRRPPRLRRVARSIVRVLWLQRRPRQRAVRPPHRRRAPARSEGARFRDPGREDRGRHPRSSR